MPNGSATNGQLSRNSLYTRCAQWLREVRRQQLLATPYFPAATRQHEAAPGERLKLRLLEEASGTSVADAQLRLFLKWIPVLASWVPTERFVHTAGYIRCPCSRASNAAEAGKRNRLASALAGRVRKGARLIHNTTNATTLSKHPGLLSAWKVACSTRADGA